MKEHKKDFRMQLRLCDSEVSILLNASKELGVAKSEIVREAIHKWYANYLVEKHERGEI